MTRLSQLEAVLPGTIGIPMLMGEREVYTVPGGWVVLGIGLLFLCGGILTLAKHIAVVRHGVWTHGVVVKFSRTNKFGSSYYPVVEYTDLSGEQRQEQLPSKSGEYVGKSMKVVYDRRDPSTVLDGSSFGLWIVPSIIILIGLFSVVVGVLSLLGRIELSNH